MIKLSNKLSSKIDYCPQTQRVNRNWISRFQEGRVIVGIVSRIQNVFKFRQSVRNYINEMLATVSKNICKVEKPD